MSKRTIDYYTTIGLLVADRSESNYRIYSEDSLYDLKFIVECKNMNFSLEEIKRKLEMKKATKLHHWDMEKQIDVVTLQMKQLKNDISVLLPILDKLDDEEKEILSKKLSLEGSALLKFLMSLTS